MNRRFVSLLSIAAFALAACGGGQQGAGPSVPNSAGSAGTAIAQFVVHWPSAATSSSARRPQTISKSAQSISVSVNGGPVQVANKPTTGFPTTTTISINAPVGTDTFTLEAWDQPGAQGNVLDATTVSQLIVANATNTVSAVLDGQCAGLLIQPVASQPFVQSNTSTVNLQNGTTVSLLSSLRIVGVSSARLTVTPVDADGNTIVFSSGAPVIALTESGTTQHVSSTSSTTSGVTTFTLTPTQGEASSNTTTLTASSPQCTSTSPTLKNQVTLGVVGAIYVGDTNSVFAYDQDGNLMTSVSTGHPVTGVAWDAINKRIDVVTSTSGTAGKAGLFIYSPTLTAVASGTLATTITLNSATACNSVANIAVPPTAETYQLLVLCPSTDVGTTPGFIHTLTVAVSGTAATTTDDTAAAPAWEMGGTTHLYNPLGVLIETGGTVIEGDQSSSSNFNAAGAWQKYIYSSGWTSFALSPQQNGIYAAYNSTSIYEISLDGASYITNYSLPQSADKIATCPANGAIYAFSANGAIEVYSPQNTASSTLLGQAIPGNFTGLVAPVQAIATL